MRVVMCKWPTGGATHVWRKRAHGLILQEMRVCVCVCVCVCGCVCVCVCVQLARARVRRVRVCVGTFSFLNFLSSGLERRLNGLARCSFSSVSIASIARTVRSDLTRCVSRLIRLARSTTCDTREK
jgi:hypothetical protein